MATKPVQGTESGAAPAGDEPGPGADKDCGGAGPTGNSKGGWATGSVGHDDKKSRSGAEAGGGGEREDKLIKHHMARDEDPTRGKIIAPVPLVVRGYPRKTQRVERGASLWGAVAVMLG